MFVPDTPPVIIVGMHRSGTSMLTRFLEKPGLFVGAKKSIHDESTHFFKINRWLLLQSGGRWDVPAPFKQVLSQSKLKENFVKTMKAHLNMLPMTNYWGIIKSLDLLWDNKKSEVKWGWKDPRNTITLPLWLEIFPDAKILHIKRHGVDVAKSLRKRSQKKFNKNIRKKSSNSWFETSSPREEIVDSPKTFKLNGGLELWDYYLETFSDYKKSIDNETFEMTFEELLEKPQSTLSAAVKFCGLNPEASKLTELCDNVRKSRRNAWHQDEELVKFAQKNEGILEKHGY